MGKTSFWNEALALRGSVTPLVAPCVAAFGAYALLLCLLHLATPLDIDVPIAPAEVVGAALGVVLIMRTTAGYERWWEGRKAWGGIVNQSRNLAIIALEYGPNDAVWRQRIVRQVAGYAHAVRVSLRRETDYGAVIALLDPAQAVTMGAARFAPCRVARLIAQSLRQGTHARGLSGFAFLEAERQLAQLVDNLGICERIRDAPLPRVCAIKIRRFLLLFLGILPLALLNKAGWLTPLYTMLAAYALLSLDQLGIELQNPFTKSRLSHLPLDELCRSIEGNLMALAADDEAEPHPGERPQVPPTVPNCAGLAAFPIGTTA
jgi:putative membrane protein